MRKLTALEINHLYKHGFKPSDISAYGETPVEYISGFAEFKGNDFLVTPNTLIPRVETELLVDLVIGDISQNHRLDDQLILADIGTGSGCIGISLAMELQKYSLKPQIILSDISEEALAMARQNAARLLSKQDLPLLKIFQSDLLLDFPDSLQPNVIVANLPYIPFERKNSLDSSVVNYEPETALFANKKGMSLITQLINQAESLPKIPQTIYLEIDEFITQADWEFVKKYQVELIKDNFDRIRFAQLSKK